MRDLLFDYLEQKRREGCSPATVNLIGRLLGYYFEKGEEWFYSLAPITRSVIHTYLQDFSRRYGLDLPLPTRPKNSRPQTPRYGLTREQIERIVSLKGKGFNPSRRKALALFLLDTGLRLSEALAVRLSDIDWKERRVQVRCGKGGEPRIVFFSATTALALIRYLSYCQKRFSHQEFLFVDLDGRPLNAFNARSILKTLGKHLGFPLFPHLLRHTFAISWIRNGGSLVYLQRLLGHKKLETTLRYLQFVDSELGEAYQRYAPLASGWK